MKNLWLGLLVLILPLSGFAQSLELEVIRTESAPGFFAVRIFPDPELKEINMEDVFVKNFSKEEAPIYHDLISILEELDGTVIRLDQLPQYTLPTNRIILLGGKPHGDFVYFKPQHKTKILEEFDAFAAKNLGPPILMNITADFGGNVTDVYPKRIIAMTDKPVFFVGKFTDPIKTKMTVTALTHEGEIMAETALHLEKYEPSAFSEALPEIWEEVYQSKQAQKENSKLSFYFEKAFPWILGLLGIILLVFTVSRHSTFTPPKNPKTKLPKNKQPKEVHNTQDLESDLAKVPEGFWHQPKEKVDSSLPFSEKQSKTTESMVKDFYTKK